MRWTRHFLLAILMFLTAQSAGADSELTGRLDSLLSSGSLRGAEVAALVVRERDGREIYAHSPDRALIPASNLKILTAISALDVFGPSHQFETVILADRRPDDEGFVQDLLVRGGGDPVLNSEDWWRLAADLRRGGLRGVRGDVLVDDSAFDSEYWHPDWGKVSSRAYHAPVGALTANYGAYFVRVMPGARPEDPVRVDVDPPTPYLRVLNLAATGKSRANPTLVVGSGVSPKSGEVVEVRGVVRAGDEADVFPRRVTDPALYAGAVFKMQLEANGIHVAGNVRRAKSADIGEEILRFEGRPLSEIVRLFVKYSNNSIAESLIKSLGARAGGGRGTWQAGLAEMRRVLGAMGLAVDGLKLADGSGLSPANRASPRLLVDALRFAHRSFDFGPELMTALPIAARDGTLEKRSMDVSGLVRAKTGLLSAQRATSLSGFARLQSGELAVFSILVNGYREGSREGMDAVDRWLAAWVGRETEPATRTDDIGRAKRVPKR